MQRPLLIHGRSGSHRGLAVEIHEDWIEATRYLNMDFLREHKKEQLRARAAA